MSKQAGIIRLERDGPPGVGLERMDLDPADFASGLPEQRIHVYFADEAIGLTVGVWTTTGMQEAFGPYPGDEFMLVLEGRVVMEDGHGGAVPVETGQSFVIRNAIPVSWKQVGAMRKFFLLLHDAEAPVPQIASAEGGVIVMDPEALRRGLRDEAEMIGGGHQQDNCVFTNDAGTMSVGLWTSTAFETDMQPFSVHEFVQILDGHVAITEGSGATHAFGPGDVFFVPAGTVCSWASDGAVSKYYATVTPPS
jgi:hypothetical protein